MLVERDVPEVYGEKVVALKKDYLIMFYWLQDKFFTNLATRKTTVSEGKQHGITPVLVLCKHGNKNTRIPSIKIPLTMAHRNHYLDSRCTLTVMTPEMMPWATYCKKIFLNK